MGNLYVETGDEEAGGGRGAERGSGGAGSTGGGCHERWRRLGAAGTPPEQGEDERRDGSRSSNTSATPTRTQGRVGARGPRARVPEALPVRRGGRRGKAIGITTTFGTRRRASSSSGADIAARARARSNCAPQTARAFASRSRCSASPRGHSRRAPGRARVDRSRRASRRCFPVGLPDDGRLLAVGVRSPLA